MFAGRATHMNINVKESGFRSATFSRKPDVSFQKHRLIISRIWFGKGDRTWYHRHLVSTRFLSLLLPIFWSSGHPCNKLQSDVKGQIDVLFAGLTPDELARLAAYGSRGWLSTDHPTWIMRNLNGRQKESIIICPNMVFNVENTMKRIKQTFNFGTVKRLIFPLNIGQNGKDVFMGHQKKAGNHWVLVVVNLRLFLQILYCDSLAWKAPDNLVNDYVKHILGAEVFNNGHVIFAHCPAAKTGFSHRCDWRCRNYSLQSCADVCGIITAINAAVATLDNDLFKRLTGSSTSKNPIYFQRPTQNSCYLRRVLMTWFGEGQVDIDYVSLKDDVDDPRSGHTPKMPGQTREPPPATSSTSRAHGTAASHPPPASRPPPASPPPPSSVPSTPSAPKPPHPSSSSSTTFSASRPSPPSPTRCPPAPTSAAAPNRFQCPHCGLTLSNRNCLYKHKLRKHKQASVNGNENEHSPSIACCQCK